MGLSQRRSQVGSPVRSKADYLKTVLANNGLEEDAELIAQAMSKVEAPSKAVEPPKGNPAEVSQQQLQDSEKSWVALVRGEIQAMSAAERETLLRDYKAFAVETNQLPSIIKKVEQGEWQSGLVLGELMRFHWKKTRNLEWTAG